MFRLIALSLGALLALTGAAPAAFVGTQRAMLSSPTAPQPAIRFNYAQGYFQQGTAAPATTIGALETIARAQVAWQDNRAGVWTNFTSNTVRVTNKGSLREGARTNVVKWSRDLTNILWVKSNATVTRDQIGVDNVASSASRITATAGNATVLFTTSIASSARWQSAFVKRITGTGVINMTMDNGSTWTAITPCASSVFIGVWNPIPGAINCRVEIPTQTLANPVVGFQIVTSGDEIAVDMVQNENSGFHSSSPIATTTVERLRPMDVPTVATIPALGAAVSVMVRSRPIAPAVNSVGANPITITDGSANNKLSFTKASAGAVQIVVAAGGVSATSLATREIWQIGRAATVAASFAPNNQSLSFAGQRPVYSGGAIPVSGLNTIQIGANGVGTAACFCYIEDVAIWTYPLVAGTEMALTR